MTTIHAFTMDNMLAATQMPIIAENNVNTVRLHVDFDTSWDGFGRSAVFFTDKDPTPHERVLDVDGICKIPPEVLTESGRLFISIKGVSATAEKNTTLLNCKVHVGTPTVIISDPTDNVYAQLLGAYGTTNLALAVERARMDTFVRLEDGSTTGDAELADMRVDYTGKIHNNAGEAVRKVTKKLSEGRYAFAALLPSSIGNYPRISTKDKTFTMDGDTLIINDRLPNGWVSLAEVAGNHTVTWGAEITSSAICFYYDIINNRLVARNYNEIVEDSKYILLAALRIGHGSSTGKSWAACSCPIYVDGYLNTEVNAVGGFAALLPPMHEGDCYPRYSTADNTFVVPHDTLIIDPRLADGFVSLREENGNNSVYFGEFTTSAVCIYYGINEAALVAKPYNEKVNRYDYLLLCTIRKKVATDAKVVPMVWASCPVWIDNRLSTEQKRPPAVYDNFAVKSVNHRGYEEAPENTLAAYRLSRKKGFVYVECDVSFTSDGYAVLLHDSTIDRTSNGTGNIADLTLEAVRALDFGSWKGEEYAGEKIPRFEEFMLLCKKLGLHPYIELKQGNEEQIKALVDVVKRYGMSGKVSWISFTSNYLVWVKAADSTARLGYVVGEVTSDIINTAKALKQNALTVANGALVASGENEVFIDCAASNANAAAVELCKNAGLPLEVWTVNGASAVLSLDPYISGVTSDNTIAAEVFYDSEVN